MLCRYGDLRRGLKRCLSFMRIADLKAAEGVATDPVTVKGWVRAVRKMKECTFFDVTDGSPACPVQVVISKTDTPCDLHYGSSVEATGPLVLNKNGQIELKAHHFKLVGTCSPDKYPFAPRKNYANEYVRQYLHLRPRREGFAALFRLRSEASHAVHSYFRSNHYVNVTTPIITSNDCESAGEVFTVESDEKSTSSDQFFDRKVYLTVSGQLHLEAAARSLSQVYCFGPIFRAENSKSRLHLSEFYMAEAESTTIATISDLLNEVESLVHFVTSHLLNECSSDLALCRKALGESEGPATSQAENLLSPFTVLTYEEAADILIKNSRKLTASFQKGFSLGKEHELFLAKHNGNKPLFIIDWPSALKPFYMKTTAEDQPKAMAFDLIAPNVGEVCGGSFREDNYDKLKSILQKDNLLEKLGWYLELRDFGNVTTAGYGLGFERYLQVILNVLNIKDTIPFPRWPHCCQM